MPIKEDRHEEGHYGNENGSRSSSHDSSVENQPQKEKTQSSEPVNEEKGKNKLFIKNLINDKVIDSYNFR